MKFTSFKCISMLQAQSPRATGLHKGDFVHETGGSWEKEGEGENAHSPKQSLVELPHSSQRVSISLNLPYKIYYTVHVAAFFRYNINTREDGRKLISATNIGMCMSDSFTWLTVKLLYSLHLINPENMFFKECNMFISEKSHSVEVRVGV